MEVAENLVHLGLQVTLIEATDQVMAPLDPEMVAPVHDVIREAGVDLVLGQGVTAIGPNTVTLADGTERDAELVVAAIGVRPESGLAADAGLAVSDRGAIVVDDQLRTSDPAIYALGDAVVKQDAALGGDALVPLAGPANRQGRTVADIIMGRGGRDQPVLGTAIVGVFGLQVAASGWNEKRLRAAGVAYEAIHTHPPRTPATTLAPSRSPSSSSSIPRRSGSSASRAPAARASTSGSTSSRPPCTPALPPRSSLISSSPTRRSSARRRIP